MFEGEPALRPQSCTKVPSGVWKTFPLATLILLVSCTDASPSSWGPVPRPAERFPESVEHLLGVQASSLYSASTPWSEGPEIFEPLVKPSVGNPPDSTMMESIPNGASS